MSKTMKLLWRAPSVAVAQRGPRYLEYINRDGKVVFFEPQMDDQGNISYDLDEEYGRRLLAGQPDRFFLLSPSEVIIKKLRKDNMGSEYVKVKALTSLPALQVPAETPAPAPQEPAQGTEGAAPAGAQAPGEDPALASQGGQDQGKKGKRPQATA